VEAQAPGGGPPRRRSGDPPPRFRSRPSGQRGLRHYIHTDTVTFENLTLTRSLLATTVRAPGADRAKVEEAAAAAKAGCPISKVLKLEIALELTVAT
jgi:osmotically inducible protein OsmC